MHSPHPLSTPPSPSLVTTPQPTWSRRAAVPQSPARHAQTGDAPQRRRPPARRPPAPVCGTAAALRRGGIRNAADRRSERAAASGPHHSTHQGLRWAGMGAERGSRAGELGGGCTVAEVGVAREGGGVVRLGLQRRLVHLLRFLGPLARIEMPASVGAADTRWRGRKPRGLAEAGRRGGARRRFRRRGGSRERRDATFWRARESTGLVEGRDSRGA
jgi:hypothetical protein